MRHRRTIATVLIALVTVALVAGCGAPPDKTVTGFLDDFKALNIAEAQKHLAAPGPFTEPAAEEKPLVEAIMGKVSYKVTGSTVNGGNATVQLDVTSADLVKIVGDAIQEVLPAAMQAAISGGGEADVQALMETALMNGIKSDKAPLITSQVSVTLQKSGGEWKLAMTEDEQTALFNALTGNLAEAFGGAGD